MKAPSVEFSGLSWSGDSTLVQVRVANPNRRSLTLDRADYVFRVRDETLARGSRTEPLRLPAGETVEAAFPLVVEVQSLFRLVGLAFAGADTLVYEVSGDYSLPLWPGTRRGRFQWADRLPLGELLSRIIGEIEERR